MSDDSSPDSSSRPVEPEADPVALRKPKRRYRKPDESETAAAGEPDEMTLLSALLRNVMRRRQGDDQTAAPRPKINRFLSRADAAEPAGAPVAHGKWAALPDQGGRTPEATVSVGSRTARPGDFAGWHRVWVWHRSPWARGVLLAVLIAAVAAGAFVAGRRDARRTRPAPAPWLPAFADQWARAHAAEHAGNLAAALQLTREVAAHVNLDPLSRVYPATLKTRLGFTIDAETDLVRMLGPGLPPDVAAAINAARGFNQVRARKFDLANDCFAEVARACPADAANVFYWAESLRRNGRFTDAADKFGEALARLPAAAPPYVEARRAYLAYERRLTLVEAGRDGELRQELTQHLDLPAPDAYWLLTAAAIALQRGDVPAAVEALKKAQAALPPEQFGALLADYFFRSFAYHPEMNAFTASYSPGQQKARQAGTDYFIDP